MRTNRTPQPSTMTWKFEEFADILKKHDFNTSNRFSIIWNSPRFFGLFFSRNLDVFHVIIQQEWKLLKQFVDWVVSKSSGCFFCNQPHESIAAGFTNPIQKTTTIPHQNSRSTKSIPVSINSRKPQGSEKLFWKNTVAFQGASAHSLTHPPASYWSRYPYPGGWEMKLKWRSPVGHLVSFWKSGRL